MIMRSRQSFKLIRMSLLDLFRWVITISDPFLTIVDLKWAKIQNDHSNNINIILLSCPKLHVLDVNPDQFHSWLPDLATTLPRVWHKSAFKQNKEAYIKIDNWRCFMVLFEDFDYRLSFWAHLSVIEIFTFGSIFETSGCKMAPKSKTCFKRRVNIIFIKMNLGNAN